MTSPGDTLTALTGALAALRATVGEASYPLPLPSASAAAAIARDVVGQIDDHALPRLRRLEAPLLVVVGGPTGAGKSTLINSLIRAPASPTGVLRPTTRTPLLVCNPTDAAWFRGDRALPGHRGTGGDGPDRPAVVTAPALPAGCAFLDTPDIDSVVHANRLAAGSLLVAADLLLFVTTAARYADAVPWEVLRGARERGAVVALVLNRTPPEAMTEVSGYLHEMLRLHALDGTPLFVLPDSTPDGHGLLPEAVTGQVHRWFGALTGDGRAKAAVVRQTLDGALTALPSSVATLAAAADEQVAAAEALAEQVGMAYGAARGGIERALRDGALAQGEVLVRWRAFAGSREWRLRPTPGGRLRGWWTTVAGGAPSPGRHLVAAVESGIVALIRSTVINASEQTYRSWRMEPVGRALLAPEAGPDLLAPAATSIQPGSAEDQVGRLVRQWRRDVRELVRHETVESTGRPWPAAVNATRAKVLVAAVAPGLFPEAGSEPPPLAERAWRELQDRIWVLLDAEAARYLDRLAGVLTDGGEGQRLRDVAAEMEKAREALAIELAVPEPGSEAEPGPEPGSEAAPGPEPGSEAAPGPEPGSEAAAGPEPGSAAEGEGVPPSGTGPGAEHETETATDRETAPRSESEPEGSPDQPPPGSSRQSQTKSGKRGRRPRKRKKGTPHPAEAGR